MDTSEPSHRTNQPRWLLPVVMALVVITGLVATAFLVNRDAEQPVAAAPTVSGQPLPVFNTGGDDPAIGMLAPTVDGIDFDGDTVRIDHDGIAKAIVFLAHWCPHCQAEVPVVQEWLDQRGLPEGVQLYSVSTSVDPARPNYPPAEWLRDEGWTVPLITDDVRSSVADAYGLSAFPFWVFVNADGTVAGRTSGELPPDALQDVVGQLTPAN